MTSNTTWGICPILIFFFFFSVSIMNSELCVVKEMFFCAYAVLTYFLLYTARLSHRRPPPLNYNTCMLFQLTELLFNCHGPWELLQTLFLSHLLTPLKL